MIFCPKKRPYLLRHTSAAVVFPSLNKTKACDHSIMFVFFVQLFSDPEPKRLNNGYRKYPGFLTIPGKTSLDNPEYIMSQDEGPLSPQTIGIPTPNLDKVLTNGAFGSQIRQRSSEEESDHEYYNDFDRLERELQPLKPLRKNETTV